MSTKDPVVDSVEQEDVADDEEIPEGRRLKIRTNLRAGSFGVAGASDTGIPISMRVGTIGSKITNTSQMITSGTTY